MESDDAMEPWELGGAALRDAPTDRPDYNLDERTTLFGEAIIDFCATIPLGPRTNRLVDQLTGCGTSIGANYGEADDALSKKKTSPRPSASAARRRARRCFSCA
jgi:hypothetical protein